MERPGTHEVPQLHAALMITCVVDIVAPDVGEAAVRLLRAAGCRVTCDLTQTCCGQPGWNAGFVNEAAAVARPTLDALEAELERGADVVVVPAGSCATMVRQFWPDLFDRAGDPVAAERARLVGGRTRELSELLAERADALPELRLAGATQVALQRSCHLRRELRVTEQPAELLSRVEGCEPVAWAGADCCCGFGGPFSVGPPETSVALADDALSDLATTDDVDAVVGCDASCLLHLRTRAEALGTPVEVRHLAELLAEALPAAAGWSTP